MPEDNWEDITSLEQLDFAKTDTNTNTKTNTKTKTNTNPPTNQADEDDWLSSKPVEAKADTNNDESTAKTEAAEDEDEDEDEGGEPMFIINLTLLSDGKIHSKFDRHSVNDTDAAMALRREVTANFEEYASKKELIEGGVVKPCSTSVWKAALAALRDQYNGHYFAPIFPPKP